MVFGPNFQQLNVNLLKQWRLALRDASRWFVEPKTVQRTSKLKAKAGNTQVPFYFSKISFSLVKKEKMVFGPNFQQLNVNLLKQWRLALRDASRWFVDLNVTYLRG